MTRVAWLTDVHINFLSREQVVDLMEMVVAAQPDAILIGGDIGEADTVEPSLEMLALTWNCPIYFVLGNHDFYKGSILGVRQQASALAERIQNLTYLTTTAEVVAMTKRVGLIGHDGWADARVGDYMRSLVMMNDYRLIEELRNHDKQSRLPELQRLGDEAGAWVESMLEKAVVSFEEIFLLTHVPPFRESCWYNGQPSDDEWAPHFTCMAVGHAIVDVMKKHPSRRLTVLCGHTHGEGYYEPLPNVQVKTGAAEYGSIGITELFEVE